MEVEVGVSWFGSCGACSDYDYSLRHIPNGHIFTDIDLEFSATGEPRKAEIPLQTMVGANNSNNPKQACLMHFGPHRFAMTYMLVLVP